MTHYLYSLAIEKTISPLQNKALHFVLTVVSGACFIAVTYMGSQRIILGDRPIPPLGKLLYPSTGIWQQAESIDGLPMESMANSEGLQEEVSVFWDDQLIPHIVAQKEHDMFFAQGYVEASLRLWQMEFTIFAAAGRLSEILGDAPDLRDKILEFDINQRRMGMVYGAENKLRAIEQNPEALALLDAYTMGVNAYINSLTYADYPIEYKLLDYQPSPWTNLNSCLLLMAMSKDLTDREFDLEYTNQKNALGEEMFFALYGEYYQSMEPIFPTSTYPLSDSTHNGRPHQGAHPSSFDLAMPQRLSSPPDKNIGSNNWVIHKERSKSGKPLLANDPHLSFNAPCIWVEMQISCPGYNAYGVSFPGAPGIVIGCNDSIGWGVTNAGRDVKDWYQLTINDNRTQYYHDSIWKDLTYREEVIHCRGGEDVILTIPYSHHGPVVYDKTSFPSEQFKGDLALRWRAHDPTEEFFAFYQINKASNWNEFLDALSYYSCPAQNFIFASLQGDIGLRQQGDFAVLEKGQGHFVMDGTSSKFDWKESIPFDEMPTLYNPESQYASSANQHAVSPEYPYYTHGEFEHYRNRRLNSLLNNLHEASAEDMVTMQYDNYDLFASEMLPLMLSYLDSNRISNPITRSLQSWDYVADAEKVAPSQFHTWYTLYADSLYKDDRFNDIWVKPNEYQTYYQLKDSLDHPFIEGDVVAAQTDLLNTTFDVLCKAQDWDADSSKWGKHKASTISHLLRIDGFSYGLSSAGGGEHILNASKTSTGPSWRMILDFSGEKIQGRGHYPGGQSGNPGSTQYMGFVDEWLHQSYHSFVMEDYAFFEKNQAFTKTTLLP